MAKTLPSINTASDTFQNWVDRTNAIITLIDTEVVTANTAGAVTSGNGFVNGYFGANTLVATNIKGGNVTTNSVITFQTNTTFSANVLVSQQLAVTNTVSFANTLAVTGNTTLSNTLLIVGLANASGGLNTTTANTTTAINVGANVNLTTTYINVGNSSVNVYVNSSIISIGGVNVATTATLASLGISNTVTFTGTSSQVLDSMTLSAYRSAEYVISANNNTANAYQVSKILVIHDGTTAYVTEYGTMYTNTSVMTITAGANATHMFVNCTPVSSNTTVKFTRFALGV